MTRLVPCCVRRRAATWSVPCDTLPHGCGPQGGGTFYSMDASASDNNESASERFLPPPTQRWQPTVRDASSGLVPGLMASEVCPSSEDVLNTAHSARWSTWADPDYKPHAGAWRVDGTRSDAMRERDASCSDGCWMHACANNASAPCCVRRFAANYSVACEELPHGCGADAPDVGGDGVEDLGMLGTPLLRPQARCPSFGDVANTREALREKLWGDGTHQNTIYNLVIRGSRYAEGAFKHGLHCFDGCAMHAQGCLAHRLPCCVRRMRVVEWSVPCRELRYGCGNESAGGADVEASGSNGSAAPLEHRARMNRRRRRNELMAAFAEHAYIGATQSHFGRGFRPEASDGRLGPLNYSVQDWNALPTLVPSSVCPSAKDVLNTPLIWRRQLWHDVDGKDDCALRPCENGDAPCTVRRMRVVAWPVACDELPLGCADQCAEHATAAAHAAAKRHRRVKQWSLRRGRHPPLTSDAKEPQHVVDEREDEPEQFSGPWLRARFGRDAESNMLALGRRLLYIVFLLIAAFVCCGISVTCLCSAACELVTPTTRPAPASPARASAASGHHHPRLGRCFRHKRVAYWLVVLALWAIVSSACIWYVRRASLRQGSRAARAASAACTEPGPLASAVAGGSGGDVDARAAVTPSGTRPQAQLPPGANVQQQHTLIAPPPPAPLPRRPPPATCTVRGDESVRVALCMYGPAHALDLTMSGLREHLIAPVRANGDALDVMVHAIVANDASSEAALDDDDDEAQGALPSWQGFVSESACRFALDDQRRVDARRVGIWSRTRGEWTASHLASKAKQVARRVAAARERARRRTRGDARGDDHDGGREAAAAAAEEEEEIRNVFRACYSMGEAARLALAHEHAAGFVYTHLIAARLDVAVLSPLQWRPHVRDAALPRSRAPNPPAHSDRCASLHLADGAHPAVRRRAQLWPPRRRRRYLCIRPPQRDAHLHGVTL